MRTLHIVQGDNGGDKITLEKAARRHLNIPKWVVPKSAVVGDGGFERGVTDSNAGLIGPH